MLALLAGDVRPDMVVALDRVKAAGYRTACLTNNISGEQRRPSGRRRLAAIMARFDAIIESSKVGVRKPEPRFYEIACETLGVEPPHCVFLDDLGINLKPAATMGMHTIKVVSADQAIDDLEQALNVPSADTHPSATSAVRKRLTRLPLPKFCAPPQLRQSGAAHPPATAEVEKGFRCRPGGASDRWRCGGGHASHRRGLRRRSSRVALVFAARARGTSEPGVPTPTDEASLATVSTPAFHANVAGEARAAVNTASCTSTSTPAANERMPSHTAVSPLMATDTSPTWTRYPTAGATGR